MDDNKPENAGEMQVVRDENGKFIKGVSGNPEGKKTGTKNYLTQLEEAVLKYETAKGKSLFDRLIERAFANDMVLLSVAKKFVADKTSTELSTPEGMEFIIKRADDNKND